jgi:hypothetical protein
LPSYWSRPEINRVPGLWASKRHRHETLWTWLGGITLTTELRLSDLPAGHHTAGKQSSKQYPNANLPTCPDA